MGKFSDLDFPTRSLRVEIEGQSFTLELARDPDTLLDDLLAKGADSEDVRDERIPYWADLWPSAVALGRFLVQEKLAGPGTEVTEIGCGLGLAGIVAGRLGGLVTFTDYLPEALALARHNWNRNVQGKARFQTMDWREPDPALAADLILAADVAYEARAFDPLPHAFHTLCRPGGTIILTEPDRPIARPFLDRLPDLGFRMEKHRLEGALEGLPYRVNVCVLQPAVD